MGNLKKVISFRSFDPPKREIGPCLEKITLKLKDNESIFNLILFNSRKSSFLSGDCINGNSNFVYEVILKLFDYIEI